MRATFNISLPEEMRDWVESHVSRAGYATASEYFRHLVREDQLRQKREKVEARLLEALESGEPIEITPEWWQQRRAELERRIKTRAPKP